MTLTLIDEALLLTALIFTVYISVNLFAKKEKRKKYCFTQCFKRKMSILWENVLGGVIALLILIGILIVGSLIAGAIGWLWLTFMHQPIKDVIPVGFGIVILSAATGWIIYMVSKIGAHTTTQVAGFVKDRYEREPYQCSVFEECTEEN